MLFEKTLEHPRISASAEGPGSNSRRHPATIDVIWALWVRHALQTHGSSSRETRHVSSFSPCDRGNGSPHHQESPSKTPPASVLQPGSLSWEGGKSSFYLDWPLLQEPESCPGNTQWITPTLRQIHGVSADAAKNPHNFSVSHTTQKRWVLQKCWEG